ncbi:hypothetical protein Tco_0139979 [Tanacetum coccineum]
MPRILIPLRPIFGGVTEWYQEPRLIENQEQAPPSPPYLHTICSGPVYPEFLPVDDEVFPAEEQPLPAADSPTHSTGGDEDDAEDRHLVPVRASAVLIS